MRIISQTPQQFAECVAGFRREYGLDYRRALTEMMWQDVVVLIDALDKWTMTDENIARLVDRDDYYLNAKYGQWTTDPDDPEVKAEQAKQKLNKQKPPPNPILTPVAMRPTEITNQIIETNIKIAEKYFPKKDTAEEKPAPGSNRKVSIKEFLSLRGK